MNIHWKYLPAVTNTKRELICDSTLCKMLSAVTVNDKDLRTNFECKILRQYHKWEERERRGREFQYSTKKKDIKKKKEYVYVVYDTNV